MHALLINGGGSAQRNYQSHLLHVRELVKLLRDRGVGNEDMTVFASDGASPAADLAVLDERPEKHFWLIQGLPLGARLRPEVRLVDSRVAGVDLLPATRAAIDEWFATEGAALEPGTVLLLYVTDHGHKNSADLADNSIVLWGEQLGVKDLGRLLARLPAGVRTVMLMSQCFSGSFANVVYGRDAVVVDGSACGFFSSPADRFAYGCYPENRGKENVGHSFHFLDALRIVGAFDRAHEEVLLTDRTPDVPNRTSEHYLRSLVRSRGGSYGLAFDDFADRLLEQAWADEIHYADTFRRIDEIGRIFGTFGPRSYAELNERTRNLPQLRDELRSHGERWRAALDALKSENLARFLRSDPHWSETLEHEDIRALGPKARRTMRRALLRDLASWTAADARTAQRLRALRSMTRAAQEGAYRMEVRIAATLRMRDLLGRIAGEVFLERYAGYAERAAYEALRECERFALEPEEPVIARLDPGPPFPPLESEAALLATVLPGWLGLQFSSAVGFADLDGGDLPTGAVAVTEVVPGSPAATAGIVSGDVVLGPPGDYFVERSEIREWVMTSIVDQVRELDVLRDGRVRRIAVKVSAAPSGAR